MTAIPTDLKTHITNFKKWLETDTGDAQKWQKERMERLAWYRDREGIGIIIGLLISG